MKKTIQVSGIRLMVGSALRRALHLFEGDVLAYDPELPARCNDVVLADVISVPKNGGGDLEGVDRGPEGLRFFSTQPEPGLIAITVGNHYAPPRLIGGLNNPIDGTANGEIVGGTVVHDLCHLNVAGFINHAAEGVERAQVRVLGTLINGDGSALNLEEFRHHPPEADRRTRRGILVCGHGVGSGKTTCCVGLARELRARGLEVTYEKKTGTSSFRDPLRTLLGDYDAFQFGSTVDLDDYEHAPVCDLVEAAGTVSDVSAATDAFVRRSVAFTAGFVAEREPDVHLVELARNFSHRANLALLANPRFRDLFDALVYVPDPSYDAAAHFLYYVAKGLVWGRVPVVLTGPIANEPRFEAVAAEIRQRHGVHCLPCADENGGNVDAAGLVDWLLNELRN